jgi:hypothetical protein
MTCPWYRELATKIGNCDIMTKSSIARLATNKLDDVLIDLVLWKINLSRSKWNHGVSRAKDPENATVSKNACDENEGVDHAEYHVVH